MEEIDAKERRLYLRVPMPLEMEVFLLSDSGKTKRNITSQQCQGRDISKGGVSFFANIQYQPDELLRLRISFNPHDLSQKNSSAKLLKVMGKVMWCRKSEEENRFVTGVEFLNIYEDDFHYLREYVKSYPTS